MKIVLSIILLLNLFHVNNSQTEEDLEIAIISAVGDKKVVTASGQPEIGVKLGNVTLEKFSGLPTQIWTLIRIDRENKDADMVVELIAKENEQNTLTSYLNKGAHSYNQWELYLTVLKEENYFQMHNQRNSKCLNNMDGKLFYSICEESAMGQMWSLQRAG